MHSFNLNIKKNKENNIATQCIYNIIFLAFFQSSSKINPLA